jgi:hypothetical protein
MTQDLTIVGIDLAKSVFQVVYANRAVNSDRSISQNL